MDIPEAESPVAVELAREAGLTLEWADGTRAEFGLEELRFNCPCAGCRSRREQGLDAWPLPGAPQPLRAESAELVGAWGIQIRWNDGHDTGIYAWGMLRAWESEREDDRSGD